MYFWSSIMENSLTRLPRCRSDKWISFMLDLPSRRRLGAPFVVTVYHLTGLHASLTPFYIPASLLLERIKYPVSSCKGSSGQFRPGKLLWFTKNNAIEAVFCHRDILFSNKLPFAVVYYLQYRSSTLISRNLVLELSYYVI